MYSKLNHKKLSVLVTAVKRKNNSEELISDYTHRILLTSQFVDIVFKDDGDRKELLKN